MCVKAKGKDWDHRKDAGKERGLSEYAFDYCFPGDELGFKVTVLVGRESDRDEFCDGGADGRVDGEVHIGKDVGIHRGGR